jgi:hypothetical protein
VTLGVSANGRRVLLSTVAIAAVVGAAAPSVAGAAHTKAQKASHAPPTSLGQAVASGTPPIDENPLAANGFSSPTCTTPSLYAQISPTERTNCEVSGVAVAGAPLSNYGFDTNIEGGLEASVTDDLDSVIEQVVLSPIWIALVWLVHVAVVALEWCYSIDLLAPSTLAAISSALSSAESIFTVPWLGLVFSFAAIAAVWQGIIRRRVIETLGTALLMVAMMGVGLWIVIDPAGTVGAVAQLADEAALGTVAATATGTANTPVAGFDSALGDVFDSAVTGPWCYLEFGDVNWCSEPSQEDQRLRSTAVAVESTYRAAALCNSASSANGKCTQTGGDERRAYAATAIALGAARTNAALFLALPAGGFERNSLASGLPVTTLYDTLCGSTNATDCTASTAPQAEFRTAIGVWPRAGGLLLIAIGMAGMLAMLFFIALRLIGAAVGLLLYLLLAPLVVLAPALGEVGRATFRLWLTRLAGAAIAKLVYSLLLGVELLGARLIESTDPFGWWTQWLVFAVFWWFSFANRHRLLGFAIHERSENTQRRSLGQRLYYNTRSIAMAAGAARFAGTAALVARARGQEGFERLKQRRPREGARPVKRPPTGPVAQLHRQTDRMIGGDIRRARELTAAENSGPESVAPLQARLKRLQGARQEAVAAGDRRRAASLDVRREGVEAELARRRREKELSTAHDPADHRAVQRVRARHADRLDREARAGTGGASAKRDYAALAPLVGLSAGEYGDKSPSERRWARAQIERELERRRHWLVGSDDAPPALTTRRVVGPPPRPPLVYVSRHAGRRSRQFGPGVN